MKGSESMQRLENIEHVAEMILEAKSEARENDDVLYMYVCEHFDKDMPSLSMKNFLLIRNKTNCPSYASVSRARRKVFSRRPELKPDFVSKCREEMEVVYKEYALN
jgi:hypothetical protein